MFTKHHVHFIYGRVLFPRPSFAKPFFFLCESTDATVMDCKVCVIGLGVSSIPLLKLLQQSGTDFRVVTSTAFGIWRKLADAGENFQLVTTIESTNYRWWESEFCRLAVCLCVFHLPIFVRLLLLILKPLRVCSKDYDYDFPFYTSRSYYETLNLLLV